MIHDTIQTILQLWWMESEILEVLTCLMSGMSYVWRVSCLTILTSDKSHVSLCSDVYSGTRNASAGTGNLIFHGKYIVMAIIQDLIDNTWITQAEEVVLIGLSTGAIGTESNCDMLADMLHRYNSDIKVKCISDSGTRCRWLFQDGGRQWGPSKCGSTSGSSRWRLTP